MKHQVPKSRQIGEILLSRITGKVKDNFKKKEDVTVISNKSERKETFSEEKTVLSNFITENKDLMSEETLEMMRTWLLMLEKYPVEVRDIDLVRLHNYMVEKSEYFFRSFQNRTDDITIEKNEVYVYEFQSLSLTYGPIILLYPFMFLYASNYWKFTQIFCRKLEKQYIDSKIDLGKYLSSFWEILQRRMKIKLLKRDVSFLVELSKTAIDSRAGAQGVYRKYRNNKQYRKLSDLRVISMIHNVNFSSLGLIPYISLIDSRFIFPLSLKPFIEQKLCRKMIFRLILIPTRLEQKWQSELEKSGLTAKLEEWYIYYNWKRFSRTARGFSKWNLDPIGTYTSEESPFSVNHIHNEVETIRGNISGFIKVLDAIHKTETVHSPTISVYTGFKETTVKKYIREALDKKVVLPIWMISGMGLNSVYHLCLYNIDKNVKLIKHLESFPKASVMKSQEFSRYHLYLPSIYVTKLDRFIKKEAKRGEIDVISHEKILNDPETVYKGINLIDIV